MIIKKTYSKDDYIIFKLTNIFMLNGITYLNGKVIETIDPEFRKFNEVVLTMNENVEVVEP